MTTKTTRILKEARPLFWPWCAVVLAGAAPLIRPFHSIIGGVVLFLGIPLLATLPFGNEFQHRTISLLLSQPVNRMEIWCEKLGVAAVAVLSAALVFFFAEWVASIQRDPWVLAWVGMWIIVFLTSATFWTLFTRSMVGGFALNLGVNTFIIIQWANLADRLRGTGYPSPGNTTVISIVILLCYAGAMLWLGRRTLARFQVTGPMAGDDLLTAGPNVMPRAWTGWLRFRPSQPILNLVRKEFRLLRPVWLISLLSALSWICMIAYGLVHEPRSTEPFTLRVASANWPAVVWIVGVCSTLMISILAGSLALGEERTSGTHSWHLTMPVPAFRQWLIKLLMSLFAGLAGAWLLPILLLVAGGSLSGLPFRFVEVRFGIFWVLVVLLLSCAAFWCACAADGTVSAVLWVFPVLVTIGFASYFGGPAGRDIIDLLVSRFDLFASLRFANRVAASFNLLAFWKFANHFPNVWETRDFDWLFKTLALVPAVLFAIFQSYRLFRAQLPAKTLSVVRSLLPLVVMAFLCAVGLSASYAFVDQATERELRLVGDTHMGIERILASAANVPATQPLQPGVEDLAKAYDDGHARPFQFAESTRRYLRDAQITVTPNKAHPSDSDNCCSTRARGIRWWYYAATLHLADGSDLTLSFQPAANGERFPHLHTYVRWQGARGQEEILPRW